MPDEQEIAENTTTEDAVLVEGSADATDGDTSAIDKVGASSQDEEMSYEEIASNLESFGDIKLDFTAILGKVNMPIEQFLKLNRGAILELGKGKDSLIDVFVNDKYIARGDIRIVNETKVGVEIKEPPVIEL